MRMVKLAFLAGAGMLTLTACSDGYYATAPYPTSGTYVVTSGEYVAPPPAYVGPAPSINPSPVNVKHYPNAAMNGGL